MAVAPPGKGAWISDPGNEVLHGLHGNFADGHPDCCERRRGEAGAGDVVKSCKGYIFRHAYAGLQEVAQRPLCAQVVGPNEGGGLRIGLHEQLGRAISAFGGKVAVEFKSLYVLAVKMPHGVLVCPQALLCIIC